MPEICDNILLLPMGNYLLQIYTYLTFFAAVKACAGVMHLLGGILLIENIVYNINVFFFCAFKLKYSEI